jgi:hypothetical protein
MRPSFLAVSKEWLVYAFVLVSASLVWSLPWTRRMLRAVLIRFNLSRAANRAFRLGPARKVPPQLEAAMSALESQGFHRVAVGRQGAAIVSIMLRQEGSILATATQLRRPVPGLPGTMVILSSVAAQSRGIVQTSNGAFEADIWLGGRITQVFPDASSQQLVARHDDALSLLGSRGVRFAPVASAQALELYGWIMSQSAAAALALSVEDFAALIERPIRQETSLRSKLREPDTLSRIDAMSG